jgi:hypothetical protein
MPLLQKNKLKKVNSSIQKPLKDNQQKKGLIFLTKKLNFFATKDFFKKDDV